MTGRTIFVLDENIASRNFLATLLREKRFSVLELASGRETLITVWRDGPDLILFDLVLADIQAGSLS